MNEQPKRRLLRFSLRSLFVVVTVYALVLAWRERPPKVTVALASPPVLITPENSASRTSIIEFPIRLTNYEKTGAWIDGYSAKQPFYTVYTRLSALSQWVADKETESWCGTGAGRHYIEDEGSATIHVEVPAKLAGQQIRVVVDVYADASTKRSFAISSDPIAIPQPSDIAAKY